MIERLETDSPRILAFKLRGKLHDEDYKHFVPVIEEALRTQGKVRLLAQFEDFHGWDLHALWDDIKFTRAHGRDIERIAMIGDKKWEEWMAKVCRPFTSASVKYFDVSALPDAWAWLREGL
jgi:hypothetical protein